MPKSSKKRKDKAADFTKAKLKLGKEKKAPSNVIDTSFKARSIALPTQSITVVKDENVPTTKRKLNIDDLVAHLKHYSPSVKRDALAGLTELLGAHWALAEQHLSRLVNHLARLISDEDAAVRKQLLAFLSWFLPRLSNEDLIPHATTLLLFTTSAQTHIFPEIRIDAMRFLALFLEHIPEPVVEGWDSEGPSHGKRILEGYLVNLNAGTIYGNAEGPPTSTPSVIISPASKLAVLRSFASFLRAGISIHSRSATYASFSAPLHAWFMSQSFETQEAFRKFENNLSPPSQSTGRQSSDQNHAENDSSDCPQHYPLVESEIPWTLQEIEETVASSGRLPDGTGAERSVETFLSELSRTIHPTLVSTILDCAPSVFAPDGRGNETETSTIMEISQIVSLLYGTILGSSKTALASSLSELDVVLNYLTPYFPFSSSRSEAVKFSQGFQDLDLMYCELTSLLVLRSNPLSIGSSLHSQKPKNRTPKLNDTRLMQVALISDYIIKLLRGEGTTTSQIPHFLSAASYRALLPSIWAIISSDLELSSHATDVTQALLDHANKTSSKSGAKRLTIEFVARLMLLETEPQYKGDFRVGANNTVRQQFENWLVHLPRVLWEIGDNDLIATEVILRFFLRLFQSRSSFLQSKIISSLALRFVPYFTINHAVRGQVSGPYSKLPSTQAHLRRLCLDAVSTLLAFGRVFGADASEGCGALSEAVDLVVVGTNEEGYWTHVTAGISSC